MTAILRTHLVLVTAVLCGSAPVVGAQSLGDAARQEAERRQTVKASSKTLTNKDLPSVPAPTAVVPSTGAPGETAGSVAEGTAKAEGQDGTEPAQSATTERQGDADGKEAGGDADTKGEAYWRNRMQQAREDLRRNQNLADAVQSRINALTTDFVNRGDPVQQAQIGTQRTEALRELDRLRKAIADGTRAVADLEEDARRAGVPAGWLR